MVISGGPDIVEDGLVLHLDAADKNSYPGTGSTWYDLSGYNSNFTIYNGAYHTNAEAKSAIRFDGVDDNVGRSTPSILQLKNDKTLEFWFNRFSTGGDSLGSLIRCGISSDLLYCLFAAKTGSSGYFYYHWYDGSFKGVFSTASSALFSLDTPNFVSARMNGTNLKIYLNGSFISNYTVTIPSPNSAGSIGIGATRSGGSVGTTAQDLAGEIYSIKIYDRALDESEILQNYNATKGRYGL